MGAHGVPERTIREDFELYLKEKTARTSWEIAEATVSQ